MSHPNDNTNLTVFNFQDQEVRVVWVSNEPMPVFADACKILDIRNPSDALSRLLFPKGVAQTEVLTKGGKQLTTCISLPNYLDFVARSDKPNAIPFREWVFGEVLPAIFKTGSYSIGDDLLSDLKKWQLSTKVVDAIVKAAQSKHVLGDKERAGYAAILLQTLRRQIYHDTRSYEGAIEALYGKGSIPNIKGDIVKMTAEIKNGQVVIQLQFPFDNAEVSTLHNGKDPFHD